MRRGRQKDRKGRTLVQNGGDGDQAIVILDNGVGRGEAETGAFRFGREVGIENALEIIFRDADALVANGDANVFAGREISDCFAGRGVVIEIIAVHAQGSPVRHGLVGIDYKVGDNLANLARINLARPQISAERELAAAMTATK
jgi:hypothetical protein